jgi:inosose dehydratase
MTSRRDFLRHLGGSALGAMLPPLGSAADADTLDLGPPTADLKVGCAAITWGGNDDQAIADIASLGFPGIQLRANAVARFKDRPGELRALLARHGLTFVALSSGNVSIDPSTEAQMIAQHVSHARFLRDAGGLYLQLIDERPRGRDREPPDYAHLGRLLTEIGKRTADLGVPVAYHHHVGSIGEKPDEIARVLDATDPRYVRLLLDVAHYQVGGGDPAAAIRRHADRLLFLHLKDVRMRAAGAGGPPFQFVELGRGSVDLPAVFAALRAVSFSGWAVVELDGVSESGRTPKEANQVSKGYLERVIGLRVG